MSLINKILKIPGHKFFSITETIFFSTVGQNNLGNKIPFSYKQMIGCYQKNQNRVQLQNKTGKK